jgi:hypothetical protein
VAVYPTHDEAEKAVKSLTAAGFDMKHLSVVGKGYHSEPLAEFIDRGEFPAPLLSGVAPGLRSAPA